MRIAETEPCAAVVGIVLCLHGFEFALHGRLRSFAADLCCCRVACRRETRCEGRRLAQLIFWVPALQLLFGNLQFPGPAFVAPVFAVYLLQKLFTPAGGSTVPAAASLPSTGYTSQLEPFDLGLALRAATMNRARGINASSAIDVRHLRIAWACLGPLARTAAQCRSGRGRLMGLLRTARVRAIRSTRAMAPSTWLPVELDSFVTLSPAETGRGHLSVNIKLSVPIILILDCEPSNPIS